ncbi:MAG: CIA30 family protein [Phycisphaeraceae bacterium]|nr:CIA30 family protein [Phycisphaeraceae bacterium]
MKWVLTTSRILIALTGLVVLLSVPMTVAQAATPDKPLAPGVIDDFRDTKTNPWEFITDKVMGGKSTGKMEFVTHEDRPSLHLTGSVSSKKKNNFIQARRPVDPKKKYFNASDYDGLRLKVKSSSATYAVHFKTSSTLFPWQHYQAEFKTVDGWQEVIIPFKDFKPQSLRRTIKTSKLKTIGIVAMKKDMKVDLYIHEIAFYKKVDLKDTSAATDR